MRKDGYITIYEMNQFISRLDNYIRQRVEGIKTYYNENIKKSVIFTYFDSGAIYFNFQNYDLFTFSIGDCLDSKVSIRKDHLKFVSKIKKNQKVKEEYDLMKKLIAWCYHLKIYDENNEKINLFVNGTYTNYFIHPIKRKDFLDRDFNHNLIYVRNYDSLLQLMKFFREIENKDIVDVENFIFSDNHTVLKEYQNRTLEKFDLSAIDFDNRNISGLDISKNPEVHIHFNKIIKDISNCNFNGYDLKKVIFRDFNIQNTDFRNTSATIDLGSCMISYEGKMQTGTLFDEKNKFLFNNKKLTQEEVENLGIKIFEKER